MKVSIKSDAKMVGSTQIMIRKSVYEELIRFRDHQKLRSCTIAIKELLDFWNAEKNTYAHVVNVTKKISDDTLEQIEIKEPKLEY